MTYIDTKRMTSQMVPGRPIGDAKTLETRGVSFAVNPDGTPVETFEKGSVVYIDNNGYAVPFSDPLRDFENGAKPVPYGVVYLVDAKPPRDLTGRTPTNITPHANEVKVVVEGVVPIKMQRGQTKPHIGQMVNPYGGAMTMNSVVMTPLGICDGVETRGTNVYVAVRLTPGSGDTSNDLHSPRFVKCRATAAISKFQAVYLDGQQYVTFDADALVKVKPVSPQGNNIVFGYAWESTQDEPIGEGNWGDIQVLYFGVGYFPFVYPTNSYVQKLAAANGGKVPDSITVRVRPRNGSANDWLDFALKIIECIPYIGDLVEVGCNVYRLVKDNNATGKSVDVQPASTAKFRELMMRELGDGVFEPEVEIDGMLGVFVNPTFSAPVPITRMPLVIADEGGKSENILIREGTCYVGSYEGVREVTSADTPDGVTFYGVATEPIIEDEPRSENEPQHIRVVRDGVANVLAHSNWDPGSFIDIHGKAILPDDEEFVPHIGRAIGRVELPDGSTERLGKVDIRPFSPNQYLIVDHCKLNSTVGLWDSVFVQPVTGVAVEGYRPSQIEFADVATASAITGVTGVLTRYEANVYGSGEYQGRAVVQISGYVRCDAPDPLMSAGTTIASMDNHVVTALAPLEEPGYMNILGTLLRTDPPEDTDAHWWVVLAPRTQYYTAAAAANKKE